jgi:SAM-dependent methyltransferase
MTQSADETMAGRVGDRTPDQFWNDLYENYRNEPAVWGARPNPVLVDTVADLDPGTALDLACGAGGDTLWPARHGWRVTAVDISATAVEQVHRHKALGYPAGIGERDLRLHRSVLQPDPAALQNRNAQPRAVRTGSHRHRTSGVATTPKPSGEPGQSQHP